MDDPAPSLVIDTHVWFWLMTGDIRLKSSRAVAAIEKARETVRAGISVISVWEIAMLEAKNRIVLPAGAQNWINEALALPGYSLIPLSREIAIASTRLPGEFHGDPADQIIVATARVMAATLVTADKRILAYAKKGFVSALAA